MENKSLRQQLSLVLENSRLLKTLESIRLASGINRTVGQVRSPAKDEIKALLKQNNFCSDWNRILVHKDFSPEFIINSRFYGSCVLGKFSGRDIDCGDNIFLPTGIYNTIICNSEIGSESLAESCGIISNYIISPGTALFHVKNISSSENVNGSGSISINIGPETGERRLTVFAEMNLTILNELLRKECDRETYEKFIKAYRDDSALNCGLIGEGCIIRNTISITDSIITSGTVVSGAGIIDSSIITGDNDNPAYIGYGAEIKNSAIQQGCRISSMALIHNSLIMENSECEKKCIISSSITGPGSSIGEAEITSSFTGPLTSAHHHSLLIAAIWPGGRGNIGYGANVGSNHTSRLPDQEIFPGEGMFFGLGTSIKFPADYRKSPYSIISTGVTAMPQAVEFPFSLINQPSAIHEKVPPHFNELFPGWGLYRNIYALVRNESKFIKRNRPGQNRIDLEIFRPENIELMIDAAKRLEKISIKKDLYTREDISGAGKNYITEENRVKGIEAYNFHITLYALKHLSGRVAKVLGDNTAPEPDAVFQKDDEAPYWTHAMSVLEQLKLRHIPIKENLEKYIYYINIINEEIIKSRERDYTRGMEIIQDYAQYHQSPELDPLILELKEKHDIEKSRLLQILKII